MGKMRRSTSSIRVFGVAQALCLAILLNWSITSAHALDHYDHHGEEEGSGYYYKTQYNENGGCDFKHQIGYKESFPIYNFPPEVGPQAHNYQRHGIPPQQCVWEFVSRKHDNCTLEFHTHPFRRGNTRCEEGYLLIGDEYGDRKVCGYSKAPRRFISSGKKLFLGSYRRNGYEYSVGSSVSGVIRCVKNHQTYENHNETYIYNNGSTGGCSLSPPNCTLFPPVPFNFSKSSTTWAIIGLFANSSGIPPILRRSLDCPSDNGCEGQGIVCFQIGPASCNATTGTVVNPMDDSVAGVQCINSTAACGAGGECEGQGSGAGTPSIDVVCPAPPGQLCTFSLAICIKAK